MKTIHLPADHVQFGELAHLIASALHPLGDDSSDREMMAWGAARGNLEAELLKAVKTGTLLVKDPLTMGPHTFPVGDALNRALVSVDDLRDFLVGRGVAVEVIEPQPTTPEPREKRQDRRLQACIDAGLSFKQYKGRLPDGVGNVADLEGVTRQSFSIDVKAALSRRGSTKREVRTVHRA